MSYFTTIYDTVLSSLASMYSEKTRIFDAYSLSDNPEFILRDGYGLRIGSTDKGPAEFKSFRDDHVFQIVLTKEVIRHDAETTPTDNGAKALKEDAFEVRERFWRSDKLGLPTQIENIDLGSISGVEQFLAGKTKFLSVTIDLIIQVREISS